MKRMMSMLVVLSLFGFATGAGAATYYWDDGTVTVNGASGGGTGTWTVGAAGWEDGSSAQNWADSNDAVFGGTAGTVTLGGAITAGTLTFNTANYVLDLGANALTFTSLAGSNLSSITIKGAGSLTKSGAGDVTLYGNNTYSGGTTISGGVLRVYGSDTALGTGTLTVSGDATLATASGGNARTLANAISIASGKTLSFDSGYYNLTLNGAISGLGGVATVSSGTTTLGGNNTYTGATTIGGAQTLKIAGNTNVGAGTVYLGNGSSVFQILSGGSFTTTGQLSSGASGAKVQVDAGGNLSVGSLSHSWPANVVVNGTLTSSGAWTFSTGSSPNNSISGAGTISVASVSIKNYANVNFSATGSLTVSGTFTMGDATNQSGNFTQSAGTVNLTTTGADNIRIGHWPSAASTYTLSGGTLNAVYVDTLVAWDSTGTLTISGGTANMRGVKFSSGTRTQTGNVNLSGGATLNIGAGGIYDNSSGANPMNITLGAGTLGALASWSSSLAMSLTNSATTTIDTTGGNITLSGVIGNSTTGALTKAGPGTLTLSNASNTYTGATTVSAGVLNLTGGLASAITVNSGAILTGTGSTSGNITFNAGSGILASASGANAVQGVNVTANATTSIFVSGTPSGTLQTVDVIRYTGTTPGTANFSAATNYRSGALTDTGSKITLGYQAEARTWGGTAGTWDVGTATTWATGGSNDQKFYWGDSVTFNNAASQTVTLSGSLAPSSVTVSNNSGNTYTFGGTGGIVGATGLTKSGAGTLTIGSTVVNTYTGATALQDGTLSVANLANALGATSGVTIGVAGVSTGTLTYTGSGETFAKAIVMNGNANINNTGSGTLTLSGPFANTNGSASTANLTLGGSGAITMSSAIGNNTTSRLTGLIKDGTGILTLSGANTYTGVTTIKGNNGTSGEVRVSSINNGGVVGNLGAASNAAANIVFGATGSSTGKLVYTGAGESTDRLFTINGNAIIENNGTGALNFTNTGSIVDSGGNQSLTLGGTYTGSANTFAPIIANKDASNKINVIKTGTGTWKLTGASTFTGGTTINDGALKIGVTNALASGYGITMTGGELSGAGNGTYSISPSSITISGSSRINTAAGDVSLNIAGTGGIASSGTVLYMSGTHTYSGTTTISGSGYLEVSGAALNIANSVLNVTSSNATRAVDIWSGKLTVRGLTGTGIIAANGSNGGAFTGTALEIATPASESYSFSGTLKNGTWNGSAVMAIVKTGDGTQILSGANSYTGGTTVNAGTLQAGSTSATNGKATLNGGSLTITSGVTYDVDGGLTFASNTGATVAAASGSATLRGFDVNNADVIVNTGINGSIASSVGISTYSYGMRFDVNGTGTLSVAGAITGSGNAAGAVNSGTMVGNDKTAVWKRGTGDLTLTGASSFTAGGGNNAATSLQEGRLILSGGNDRLPVDSAIYLGNTANTSGKLVLDGINQTVTGIGVIGTGTSNAIVGGNATSSTLTVNNTNNYSFGGKIGGAGTNENNLALTKSGNGTLTLTGTSTYTGATSVVAGVLELDGTLASQVTASNTGTTIKGTGTFGGGLIMTAGTIHAPGNSPGTEIVSGTLEYNSSTLVIDIWTDAAGVAGTDFDQITIDGGTPTLTLINSPNIVVDLNSAWNPAFGNSYKIIQGFENSVTSGFNPTVTVQNASAGWNTSGNSFSIVYNTNDITLTVIPEPGTAGIVATFLAAALLRRRRRAE